ncbi:family 10 glycosylhydrolase [Haloferula sp. BvORR071]|uniref:glycoside hydrolase family 10 protein n=1 Tax=Haloferula sp. BvORR071 TaxID=1396141 RepID=UPI00055794A7|nr:family 10 glycosylhydrolase [Haloferula sp. BvORR071]
MLARIAALACLLSSLCVADAQSYRPSGEKPPMPAREFRAAWAAVVHNIDWPSKSGMSAGSQQAEMDAILDRMASLNMNALLLQVRPHCDAVYQSSREPWSPWLTGTMGKSPGYDPLEYCVRQAHARGIEVHAWFNPFRALSNASQGTCSNHVCQASPNITKRYGNLVWCDPAETETRARAFGAILDVVQRYDIDGVHLDDYFYPYPEGGRVFPDGRSPAIRRKIVDDFVQKLYSDVKARKPWVRVGISPFGIWRPGVPEGIEAGIDAYEQIGCDARKWLANGWVDYLAPQLYWRDQPRKQSFSALLGWWRQQGSRPVWPGIATTRINSSEDPGRPASEITKQVDLSRSIGKNWAGHIHWSVKGLTQNRGGISTMLAKGAYSQAALVPPMPWMSQQAPGRPSASAAGNGSSVKVDIQSGDRSTSRYAIQARYGSQWKMAKVVSAGTKSVDLSSAPDAVAVSAVDRFGNISAPVVLTR